MATENNKFNLEYNMTCIVDPGELRKKNVSKFHNAQLTAVVIIKFVLVLIAGYLCWGCNVGSNMFTRILFTIISGICSEIYILYYVVYRVYMGNSCTA